MGKLTFQVRYLLVILYLFFYEFKFNLFGFYIRMFLFVLGTV